jgi:hypothetical protein
MQPWVLKALQRWPNVPAVFGWLSLDRRGRWLIKDEFITRPQIIETINANYGADEFGRWYFQNGPQRGYMRLAYAPFVVHVNDGMLMTHTMQRIERMSDVYLDEEGSLLFVTEHGPGVLIDTDLEWAVTCMRHNDNNVETEDIANALTVPSGNDTDLRFAVQGVELVVTRLDFAAQPAIFKFERDPQPRPNERTSSAAPD